jgi:hypothetical protein
MPNYLWSTGLENLCRVWSKGSSITIRCVFSAYGLQSWSQKTTGIFAAPQMKISILAVALTAAALAVDAQLQSGSLGFVAVAAD